MEEMQDQDVFRPTAQDKELSQGFMMMAIDPANWNERQLQIGRELSLAFIAYHKGKGFLLRENGESVEVEPFIAACEKAIHTDTPLEQHWSLA